MDPRDEQFEAFLREFEPRRPRALSFGNAAKLWVLRRLAAAAVILTASAFLWFLSQALRFSASDKYTRTNSHAPSSELSSAELSTVVLTRLALEDPSRFEALLDSSASNALPRFDRKNSALYVLAKE